MTEILQFVNALISQFGWAITLLFIWGLTQLVNSFSNTRRATATNETLSNAMSIVATSSQWGQEQSKELVVATRELIQAKEELAQLRGLEARVKELEEDAKEHAGIKVEVKKLRKDLETAMETIRQRDRTIDELTTERDSFKQKFETLQKRFDDLETKYNKLLNGEIAHEKTELTLSGTYFDGSPVDAVVDDGAGGNTGSDSGDHADSSGEPTG